MQRILQGEILNPLPVGFIIDSPWLPNWYGRDILDYFTDDTDLDTLKKETQNKVVMLGNIPPRDVLANGSVAKVKKATKRLLDSLDDPARIIFSCGGGMPPGVSSENIRAFIDTVTN